MNSPTPEERDPQLVAALEQAVRSHTRKHYYAGLHAGLSRAVEELLQALSANEAEKHKDLLLKLSHAAHAARMKSLDPKPTPP